MLPPRGGIPHATCALRGPRLTGSRAQVARAFAPRRGSGTRMPSPHPTNRPPVSGPTPKQLKLLRHLARTCGQTFATPRTKREASAEIDRLLAVHDSTPLEEL